ncbi:hypothetical protein DNTS_032981 [Danionella cerebrum]|uniref:Uncharacterized protein n=1 Tax=Danionella cerebrum TaxID=2873325 RepID=A0A553QY40_9TELE|nr:hypothetical protein DNTS_032981 [Danionella translucida]
MHTLITKPAEMALFIFITLQLLLRVISQETSTTPLLDSISSMKSEFLPVQKPSTSTESASYSTQSSFVSSSTSEMNQNYSTTDFYTWNETGLNTVFEVWIIMLLAATSGGIFLTGLTGICLFCRRQTTFIAACQRSMPWKMNIVWHRCPILLGLRNFSISSKFLATSKICFNCSFLEKKHKQ